MRKLLFAAAAALTAFVSAPALAQQSGPFVGQLILVSFNFCPQGYHAANGALLPIQQNPALFSLIGTTYGGNGTTTFGLPKIAGPVKGTVYCIALQNQFPRKAARAAGTMMGPNTMMGPKPKH